MSREKILNDLQHQIAFNNGKVPSVEFINKMQMLHGKTYDKIVEYLQLLEVNGLIKTQDFTIYLTEKSGYKNIRPIEKKSVKSEDKEDSDYEVSEAELNRMDEITGFTNKKTNKTRPKRSI